MEAALRLVVPVGLVRWKSNTVCFSPFVKVTYDLGASGWAVISSEQQPISEGDVQSGRVLHPSDFAEAKGACEIAIVGRAVAEHTGPGRIRVGSLTREGERVVGLLAAESLGGHGARFAGDENRVPFPSLPLEIVVEGFGPTLRSTIPGPGPEMALVIGGRRADRQPVALYIDAVLIDPRKKRCSIVFRGFFSHAGDADRDLSFVVDPLAQLAGTPLHDQARWARVPVAAEATAEEDEDEAFTPPRGTPSPFRDSVMVPATPLQPTTSGPPAGKIVDPASSVAGDPTSTLPLGAKSPLIRGELPFRRSVATSGAAPTRPVAATGSPSHPQQTAPVAPSLSHRETLPFIAPADARTGDAAPLRRPVDDALPFSSPSDPTRPVTFGPIPAASPSQGAHAVPAPRPSAPSRPVDAEDRTAPFVLPPRGGAAAGSSAAADADAPAIVAAPTRRTTPAIAVRAVPSGSATPARHRDPEERTAFFQLPSQAPAVLPFEGHSAGRFDPASPADSDAAAAPLPAALPFMKAPPSAPAWVPLPPPEQADPPRALPPPPALAARLVDVGAPLPPPPPQLVIAEPVWRPIQAEPLPIKERVIDKMPTLTLDEYAAVRAELWAGLKPRREVLKGRGLSELGWRAIERRWAAEIDSVSSDPNKLMRILSRLQSYAEVRIS